MKGSKIIGSDHAKYSKTLTKHEIWHNRKNKLTPSQFQKSFLSIVSDKDPKIVESLDLRSSTHETKSMVSTEEPIFQPSPRVLVFQEWQAFSIIEKKIFFRNNDKVARRFKLVLPDSPFFDVSAPMTASGEELKHSKVASGMEVAYTVTFKPTDLRDYSIELVCASEREKFIVPIRAVCSIPQVTLPDEIEFGRCQVKVATRKTCQVLNSSTLPVHFTLRSSHAEFSCDTRHVSIEPGAWYQLEVTFTPQLANEVVRGEIEVEFGPHQRCYIAVTGTGQNSNVYLSDPSLILASTYLGHTACKIFRIHNASDDPVDVEWKVFASDEEDANEKSHLQRELLRLEEEKLAQLYSRIRNCAYDASVRPSGFPRMVRALDLEPVQMNESRANFLFHESEDIPEQAHVDEMLIVQKYQNLHRALDKDPLGFYLSSFAIFPPRGRIWSRSHMDVTVTFKPDMAMKFSCFAYADVSGCQDRLPLHLTATGLGPQIGFSFKTYLAGDVCVRHRERCELRLRNKGEIAAVWSLLPPSTTLGHKFHFSATDGVISPGDTACLEITYTHDEEGPFHEEFRFAVQGSEEIYSCSIKGHFVPPTLHFDCSAIRFGTVSCGCPHMAHLRLVNTSPIHIDAILYVVDEECTNANFSSSANPSISHIQDDGSFNGGLLSMSAMSKGSEMDSFFGAMEADSVSRASVAPVNEFDIQPGTVALAPGDKKDIQMTFTPSALKEYSCKLCADVPGAGRQLISIPITADCKKGELVLDVTDIDFGVCFVNFPYEQELILRNPARSHASLYEMANSAQNEWSVGEERSELLSESVPADTYGAWTLIPSKAVVRASQSVSAIVQFTASRLGPFRVPATIRVAGSSAPLTVMLHGEGRGPQIESSVSDISFGTVTCLQPTTRNLVLLNSGPIPASVILTMRNHQNNFISSPMEIFMLPGMSQDVTLTAVLDDSCLVKDELRILCAEGNQVTVVRVSATGVGSTLVCDQPLDPLDLGLQMTNKKFDKTVHFTNKCPRPQSIRWVNKTVGGNSSVKALQKTSAKGDRDINQGPRGKIPSITGTFTVSPPDCVIAPGATVAFTFSGYSKSPGVVKEEFVIEGSIGKERTVKVLGQATVQCEVTRPLMAFSQASMQYSYAWTRITDASSHSLVKSFQTLTLTNSSALVLNYILSTDAPFAVNRQELTLGPNQGADVEVEFDPLYRGDMLSHTVESALRVAYKEHHQIDTLPLYGVIAFPNLTFDCDLISFGCLLNGVDKCVSVAVTNSSSCPAEFEWCFADEELNTVFLGSAESYRSTRSLSSVASVATSRVGTHTKTKPIRTSTNRAVNLQIEQVVDIVPARLLLQPGETEVVHFRMRGLVEGCLRGGVVCAVIGGPEYTLPVRGDVSAMSFSLNQSVIDFGCVDVLASKDRELILHNQGLVDFDYEVAAQSEETDQVLQIQFPTDDHYVLKGGEKAKLIFKLTPLNTGLGSETVIIRVAHFDPVEVTLYYNATVPTVFLDIPRYQLLGPRNEDELDPTTLEDAWKRFQVTCTDVAKRHTHNFTKRALLLQTNESQKISRTSSNMTFFSPVITTSVINSNGQTDAIAPEQVSGSEVRRKVGRRKSHAAVTVSTMDADLAMQRATLNDLLCAQRPNTLSSALVIANYVCDFGTIVMGASKKRTIRLVSLSSTVPLLWHLDSKFVATPDLTFDLCKGRLDLGEKADIVVKFQPTRNSYPLGPCSLVGSLYLKGSVSVCIFITANICIPEIKVSQSDVDFGNVLIGQCQQRMIKLYNRSPLPAVWKLKGSQASDARITICPDKGVLKPGKSQLLLVEYTPTDECSSTLIKDLRVEGNAKSIALRVKGKALATPIALDPPLLDFGTLIPGRSEDRALTLCNPNPFPVEVFCPEYDSMYHDETQYLCSAEFYDENGVYKTKTREPGQPLDLQQPGINHDSALFSAAVISAQITSQSTGSLISQGSRSSGDLYVPTVQSDDSRRCKGDQMDIIAVLPTQLPDASQWAHDLATKCGVPMCSLDTLLNDIVASTSEISKQVRQALKQQTDEELVAEAAQLQALQKASDDSQMEVSKKFKKQNPKAKETPAELLRTADWLALEAYKARLLDMTLTESLLMEAFQFRFSWSDMQAGCVVSIGSDADDMRLRALFNSLPTAQVLVADFKDGKEGYSDFVAYRYEDVLYDLQCLDQRIARVRDTISSITLVERQALDQMKSSQQDLSGGLLNERSPNNPLTGELKVEPNDLLIDEFVEVPSDGYKPVGNEPWFDAERVVIQDLDSLEVKALSTAQSINYWNHKLYYLTNVRERLAEKKSELCKIWNGDSDCLIEDIEVPAEPSNIPSSTAKEESSDETAPTLTPRINASTYDYYTSMIIPRIFSRCEPAEGAVPSHEIVSVTIDADEPPANIQATIQSRFGLLKSSSSLSTLMTASSLGESSNADIKTFQVIRKPPKAPDALKQFDHFAMTTTSVDAGADTQPTPVVVGRCRWILPANASMQLVMKFSPTQLGESEDVIKFEVAGSGFTVQLHCLGSSQYPCITADPRLVFMKRVKAVPSDSPAPAFRYVMAGNYYSFGPMQVFTKSPVKPSVVSSKSTKKPVSTQPPTPAVDEVTQWSDCNGDSIRIHNSGRFPCRANLSILCSEPCANTFFVEHPYVDLAEGESKVVRVFAYPTQEIEYSGQLEIRVSDNPDPVRFGLKCWGTKPCLQIAGSWSTAISAAEAAVASCTDKKLLKDFETKLKELKERKPVDFGRVLATKQEVQTIQVKSESLLPVQWVIELEQSTLSTQVQFSRMSGILPPGASEEINLTFLSMQPTLLTGGFTLKYSDAEGGLSSGDKERVTITKFKVTGEVYTIRAAAVVSGCSDDERDSEIDFGLVRVGEVTQQIVKVFNQGQYDIGFRLEYHKRGIAPFVTFEPSEGTVAAGKIATEVKVSFCCSAKELMLHQNKDIRIIILDPRTNEVVEKIPLHISVVCKYSRFRISPSRGLSFGALRFDSGTQQKSVEIRNEGQFEFRYIICPSDVELLSLDGELQAFFASAVSSTLRSQELGSDYLNRIGISLGSKKSTGRLGGDTGKSKGGSNTNSGPVSVTQYVSPNPLIIDPDTFSPTITPIESLKLGAFSISNRVGSILPGQSVYLDVVFSPSGSCEFKESFRVFISGCDPLDTACESIKAYSLSGESCEPYISRDIHQVFEEQGIIEGDDTSSAKLVGNSTARSSQIAFSVPDNQLIFGHVLCGEVSSRGIMERVKICNPSKVDCKVTFKLSKAHEPDNLLMTDLPPVISKTGATDKKEKKGRKDASPIPARPITAVSSSPTHLGFTVHPEQWDIPAREHRYVNIYFNPTEMKTYRAVFCASVDASSETDKDLTFDLTGQGTLPIITIDTAGDIQPDGSLVLDLGRVHVGRSAQRIITLKNPGIFPATCLLNLTNDANSEFIVPAHGTSVLVQPGDVEEISVSLKPADTAKEGDRSGQLRVTVLNNPFGVNTVNLRANVFSWDAYIEVPRQYSAEIMETHEIYSDSENGGSNLSRLEMSELAADGIEHLVIPPIDLSFCRKTTSTIKLHSRSKEWIRYHFHIPDDAAKHIQLSPAGGHLMPFSHVDLTATFTAASDAPLLEKVELTCELQRIRIFANQAENSDDGEAPGTSIYHWNDSMKVRRLITDADRALMTSLEAQWEKFNSDKAKATNPNPKAKAVAVQLAPPPSCPFILEPKLHDDDSQYVCEWVSEPSYEVLSDPAQVMSLLVSAVADKQNFTCDISSQTLNFAPTFLFQSMVHKFTVQNDSLLELPVRWYIENFKNRGSLSRSQSSRGHLLDSASNKRLPTSITQNYEAPSSLYCPFSIEPEMSSIAGKSSQEFVIRFSPTEGDDHLFLLEGQLSSHSQRSGKSVDDPESTMPLNETSEFTAPIRAMLSGATKRPVCHFEMQESKGYLQRRSAFKLKNEKGLFSAIECPTIRVVEVESVGLRTRNTFRFTVLNPTNRDYEFSWESVGEANSAWRCVQTSGTLFSGKQMHAVFEFVPDSSAISEAFFKFRILSVQLEQLFLFAGLVREPNVYFSTSKVDFRTVPLYGEDYSETIELVNKEPTPFNFAFDKASMAQLLSDQSTKRPILEVSPTSGVVPSNGKLSITLKFRPREEGCFNMSLLCDVKRKPSKLSLNVKGEGYAVRPVVRLECDSTAHSVTDSETDCWLTLKPAPASNYCDFGVVQVFEKAVRRISVSNNGKYDFSYDWDFGTAQPSVRLTERKRSDVVTRGETQTHAITFAPDSEDTIDGCVYTLTVAGHFKYNFIIRGRSVAPALKFSFTNFDFGPCYVSTDEGDLIAETKMLRLINRDSKRSISIECGYQKVRSLLMESTTVVLEPRAEYELPIRFIPREVKEYAFVIPFLINGTSKVLINISGAGMLPNLDLVDLPSQRLNFGSVDALTKHSKTFTLKNKASRPIVVQIVDSSISSLANCGVSVSPSTALSIAGKGSASFQVSFCPTKRCPLFAEDFMIKYAGVTKKLLTISGRAQGAEARLDAEHLSFGSVVLHSHITKTLKLENTGDLPLSFKWVEASAGPHFSIRPMTGKVSPASEVQFDVKFRPSDVKPDQRQIEVDLQLLVAGVGTFTVSCSGACVQPSEKDTQTLQFHTAVRKLSKQTIRVSNPSVRDWIVTPTLAGSAWSIPTSLQVSAKGSADLVVSYFPLTMTHVTDCHRGELLLPLPDGSALSYHLTGTADAPECQDTIQVPCIARKPAVFTLPIQNWLPSPQRLNVAVELIEKPSIATSVVVCPIVDVAPSELKSLTAQLLAHCEGTVKGMIRLTNPTTKEYMFFQFIGIVSAADIVETIVLESPVRVCIRKLLYISNPLPASEPVRMQRQNRGPGADNWWSCANKAVTVREVKPLAGNTEGVFEVTYLPLIVSSDNQMPVLTLHTVELGHFRYKLALRSSPPTQRGVVTFRMALGSTEVKKFSFRSFHNDKGEFSCTIGSATEAFSAPKSIRVEAFASGNQLEGTEVEGSVSFSPVDLGKSSDVLTVSHPVWGQYEFDLIGECVVPVPQGPIEFEATGDGSSREVPFRNCFLMPTTWRCSVDNPSFKLSTNTLSLGAKATGALVVTYDASVATAAAVSVAGSAAVGRLFITCTQRPEIPPWIYYLKANYEKNIK